MQNGKMKNFSKDLKKHTTEIIHHEKKMMRLKNEEIKYMSSKKIFIYTKRNLVSMMKMIIMVPNMTITL